MSTSSSRVAAHLSGKRWYGGEPVVDVEPLGRLGPADHLLAHVETGPPYQVLIDADGGDALSDPAFAASLLGPLVAEARLLGAEQSNTSLVYDDHLLLKVFRRVADGPNPDVEITTALADESDAPVLPPLVVWRRDARDLAVGTRFLPTAVDGWKVAVGTADIRPVAADLGGVVGRLHLASARRLGAEPATGDSWAAAAAEAAEAGVGVDGLRSLGSHGTCIRVHGDLHLGQLLLEGASWWVVDFEGEPLRSLAERRRPASPLKDVAGMLRSFAYARATAGRDEAWERGACEAFLDAYLSTPGLVALLPEPHGPVLRVMVAEKALYELRYERAHRPDWAWIPEEGLARLREEVTA